MKQNSFTRFTGILLMMALSCACEKLPLWPGPGRNDISGSDNNTAEARDTVLYFSALSFPEGYDWRRDSAYGTVSASILFFRNYEEILRINVGADSGIPTNTSWHLILDGHLFTGWCSNEKTSVMKDGRIVLEYNCAETVRGMLIEGDDIITLGQNRNCTGFQLRKNGEAIFKSGDGTVFGHLSSNQFFRSGALYRDNGKLYFCYYTEKSNGGRTWYMVTDGEKRQFYPGQGEILDIRVIDGDIYQVAKNDERTSLYKGGATVYMSTTDGNFYIKAETMDKCTLGKDSEGIFALVRFIGGLSGEDYRIWRGNGRFTKVGSSTFLYGDGMDGESWNIGACTSTAYLSEDGRVTIDTGKLTWESGPGERYYIPSFRNGFLAGNRLAIGMTPLDVSRKPVIWDNGALRELEFNGFITGTALTSVTK